MEAFLPDAIGDAELFCALVEAGGVSAGARASGSSPPAVSRRLWAGEARLGVPLADCRCDEIDLFAASQPGYPIPPRVRLFVDFMAGSRPS